MFFFQAEDGIRYLVRSRGLGDVYKRQGDMTTDRIASAFAHARSEGRAALVTFVTGGDPTPVSYTHLTLPTSDLV